MAVALNSTVHAVTERVRDRSRDLRQAYREQMEAARRDGPHRKTVSCGNLAHAFAASPSDDKGKLRDIFGAARWANIGVVTAYNDMLSAHQPLGVYPEIIKAAAREAGATAQIAGGVPAMCDGVTQGQPGMELSLLSRDVIAMATAVSLSHNVFDSAMYLGVCDKIVPGLFIAAARFGHLPAVFCPAGPMPSGLPNAEKARVRQLHAEGKVGRDALLEAESKSYHSPGTCTFYGTANSNQMLMEVMGLHLPGAAFVNPGTPLREALTIAAAKRAAVITDLGEEAIPFADVIDERAFINAVVGLHATGGSTNHTIHLIAMARAAGVLLDWTDLDDLAQATPLLTRIYPNGLADVNHFHAAGGMGFLVRELLDAGLLHEDVQTIAGPGLRRYAQEPYLTDGALAWRDAPAMSGDLDVLRPVSDPFSPTGGLHTLEGELGRAIIKVSAVKPEHRVVEAPAIVFSSQKELMDRFQAGDLDRDFIAVVPFQGPQACGMPELHKLTPPLGVLQDRGFKVALVTDGRMSGASGKVPAAIHVCPEAVDGGAIAKVRDGDILRLDAAAGRLNVKVSAEEWAARPLASANLSTQQQGLGRELFAGMRGLTTRADEGAMSFGAFDAVNVKTKVAETTA